MKLSQNLGGKAALISGGLVLTIALGVFGLIHRLFPKSDEFEPTTLTQTILPQKTVSVAPRLEQLQASSVDVKIPLPEIHNSLDTECAPHHQCTEEEFVSVLDSLRQQWVLIPEWLRTKCVSKETYSTVEDCILKQTVSWLSAHPDEQAPWVNPNSFVDNKSQLPEQEKAQVTARALSVVPGAIICRDYKTVSLMFDWYAQQWQDAKQDRLTHGQSRLIRGEPARAPNPDLYGCILVPPGTSMTLERGNVVPVVTVKLADGTTIRGVTLAGMIAE